MIKKTFSYIGIFFLNFLSLLPTPLLYFFAAVLYYPLYYIVGYRKKVVRKNLTNSFPNKSIEEIITIEKDYYKHFARLVLETIKMASISQSELAKRVKLNNLELVAEHVKNNQSILACTGHYCNWEWGMLALSQALAFQNYVIYKPLNNKLFDSWFYKMRTKFGNRFIAMRQTLRTLAATRNELTMFCFANDQTPAGNEIQYWLPFLNQETPVLLGLEKIAMQTNRPVVYFKMKHIKTGYYEVDCETICLDPSKTAEHQITDMSFNILENMINENPAYWLWSHRRWKHNKH
ncbi:lysophospholipid acyltransferase family protein [Pedobacter foliorum]|uniref:lysophospholipid acyltransferase family protein n=1 Tax=Pedobacter foliorum TaxID=2739058 RepID=UPI001563B1A5|nr:lysophospholipid acyltransferase family protein [Pedobacter foliorum]NRF37817.1 lysophospholipid acyltransferase family protein [Pedobacter foliorum]